MQWVYDADIFLVRNWSMPDLRIMAVLVVYERALQEVQAWSFLSGHLAAPEHHGLRLQQLVVYDNSAHPKAAFAKEIAGCTYVHNASNGGTAAAYSYAIRIAAAAGIEWLILLDHDTLLPPRYLEGVAAALRVSDAATAAAFVPWVYHRERVISPSVVTKVGTISPLQRGRSLTRVDSITAIASGSVLNVRMLETLLPLPHGLWLDYVDHWIFRQLHLRHQLVVILEQVLRHALSVEDPTQLSKRRLFSILDGEALFQKSLGSAARIVYPFRVVARAIRYLCIRPRLALYTFSWASRQ